MTKLDDRGVIQLIVMVILLVGLVAGVYLVQNYTHILPFAASEPLPIPTPIASSSPISSSVRVFVSSATYDGNLGGISGANAKCQSLADKAYNSATGKSGLGGTWKAWLGIRNSLNSLSDPSSTFVKNTVPYRLVDGTLIANNWTDLTDGSLQNKITRDEEGRYIGSTQNVWTNVSSNGTANGNILSTYSCESWSSNFNLETGAYGDSNSISMPWTNTVNVVGYGSGTLNCSKIAALYCFEQTSTPTPSPTPPPDLPPTVNLTSPLNNAYLPGSSISLRATATDDKGVTKVEFYLDNSLLGTSTTSPYGVSWNTTPLADGSIHSIGAIAYDTGGNKTKTPSTSVTIDKTPPTVNLTNPQNGSTVTAGSKVTLSATASDNIAVGKVVFKASSSLGTGNICLVLTSPYSCTWNVLSTPGITYTITAIAGDKAGNKSQSSVTVTSQ